MSTTTPLLFTATPSGDYICGDYSIQLFQVVGITAATVSYKGQPLDGFQATMPKDALNDAVAACKRHAAKPNAK